MIDIIKVEMYCRKKRSQGKHEMKWAILLQEKVIEYLK